MSKQKKNTGCRDCKHFHKYINPTGVMVMHLEGNGDSCSNKTLEKKNTHKDPLTGESVSYGIQIPQKLNKTLTCKGFTPIDWKAKYEAEKVELDKWKDTEMDYDVQYVTELQYDKVLLDREKSNRNYVVSVIIGIFLFIALSCSILKHIV